MSRVAGAQLRVDDDAVVHRAGRPSRPATTAGRTPMPTTTKSHGEPAVVVQLHRARRRRPLDRPPACARGGTARRAPRAPAAGSAPSSAPRTRPSGTSSGATTCTSTCRARSEAATSSPMKLAPMTTARAPACARGDDLPAVVERAQDSERAASRRRRCRADRLGAGGEKERVVFVAAAALERDRAPRQDRSTPRGRRAAARCRARRTNSARAQRQPLLGRRAGQVVLRQVRAIDGPGRVGADQHQLPAIAVAGAAARRTPAPAAPAPTITIRLRLVRRRRRQRRRRALVADAHALALPLHLRSRGSG